MVEEKSPLADSIDSRIKIARNILLRLSFFPLREHLVVSMVKFPLIFFFLLFVVNFNSLLRNVFSIFIRVSQKSTKIRTFRDTNSLS